MSNTVQDHYFLGVDRNWLGPALFVLSVAAAIAVFGFGVTALVSAWSTPEYSHGPIIPLISLFLFLREMRMAPPTAAPIRDRWPGVLVVLLSLAIGLLGSIAGIAYIVMYGLMVWIAGMVLVCFGLRRGAIFWPAVLHLVFMLPLPQFIYWQVSSFLQTVSSQIGVSVIELMGIPVYLDGNIIDLGVYKLQVAEACSGLRYLFPMLSFSYVFAVLYNGPVWHKIVLLLSAAPITVAMNSFRIGVIGVLVNAYGIEQAEGFLHAFEGWIIFIACIVILFIEATLLQRISGDPRRLSETLDIEFAGLDQQFKRVFFIAPSLALMLATAATVAAVIGWVATPQQEVRRVDRDPFALFPEQIEGWSGFVGAPLDPQIEAVLGADDYHSATYAGAQSADQVSLFMAYYHNQMDGSGIHSPEVCIPSAGWEVSTWSKVTVPLGDGRQAEINRAVIQRGTVRQLVYYWFDLRGAHISGDFAAKLMNLRDSLLRGRSDGALIRLITPMAPHEDQAMADARLQAFFQDFSGLLPRFVPE